MNANARDKVRTLIVWEVPSVGSPGFIEMYINPNNMQMTERKLITEQRTKGGYIIQYWGEELINVSIAGTTGDGGVEALNVLRDIYRSEQLALTNFIQSKGSNIKRRQSLAQLAASVVLWYQGQGMRGFFKDFTYTESAQDLGMFNYQMTFTVTEVIGQRQNFLPWHRKPWSTQDNPSRPDNFGSTTGGGYGTRFKMGELNAPTLDEASQTFSDPRFSNTTGVNPSQDDLRANFEENNPPLKPSSLFANG